MKYVIVRCEDAARFSGQAAALLEGARLSFLQHLAQAGAVGLLRPASPQTTLSRFDLLRGLFGLQAGDPEAAPARWYAAGLNVKLAPGETAWCCDLVTQHNQQIIDPTAGRIPTKESEVLIQELNERLGSDTQRWEVGEGSHHLLIVGDASLGSDGEWRGDLPDLLVGQAWRQHLPKGALGKCLRALIEQSAEVLEGHAINRVRVDLGENPANLPWTWSPAEERSHATFKERTGLSGAVVSSSFPLRGFARTLGVTWKEASASFQETALHRLSQSVVQLAEQHDMVYVHLRVESADPVERLCAMERIDQVLLKPMTDALAPRDSWRLLVVVDDRTRGGATPFVAVGHELPRQPVAHLSAEAIAESPLGFDDSAKLFQWLTA